MKKKWLHVLALLLSAAIFASACGGSPSAPADIDPDPVPGASVAPGTVPAPSNSPAAPTVVELPEPSAPGTAAETNDDAAIDYSNARDGYVMAKWTGGGDAKIAVQVKGPNNPETYTYYLRTDGSYAVLPLSDGDGTYQITVNRNVSDTKYAQVLSASVDARLADAFAPFLRPNQYVDYAESSEAVKKARELVRDAGDNLGRVKAVYDWVVTNLTYDYDKATAVKTGYLPDVDRTMEEKKGICFDYASLMSAMLRSQGVPVKLVVGYTSRGEYHAWINVWSESDGWIDAVIHFDGKEWKLMDPTFASSGKQSKDVMEYITNPDNYKERFVY